MPHGERGQSTVELALCLPFVALVLSAMVQIALVAGDQIRLQHAAREAARVAVVDPDRDAALAAAQRVGPEPLQMSIDPEPTGRRAGDALTIELSHHPRGRVPLIGELFEGLTLRAEATMRIEQP